MAYTKTAWVNDNPPAINANNLNKIEQGVYDAHGLMVTHESTNDHSLIGGNPFDQDLNTTDTPTFDGLISLGDVSISGSIVENVFALSGTAPVLDPANGTIQTWALTDASLPTETFANGESILLLIDDGDAKTIDWASASVVWKTNAGVAPTLNTTGKTVISLFKVGGVLYGARVGDA